MPKVLTEATVEQFRRDGYCTPFSLLEPEEVAEMRGALERLEGRTRRASQGRISHQGPPAPALDDGPGPKSPAAGRGGGSHRPRPSCAGPANGGSRSRARPSTSSWHQDSNYWGLDTDHLVSAWVALSPATVKSGCMRFMPGSHLGPRLPHREDLARRQHALARPGDQRGDRRGRRRQHGGRHRRGSALRPTASPMPLTPIAAATGAHWHRHSLHAARRAANPGRLGQRDPGQRRGQVRLLRARADAGLRLRSVVAVAYHKRTELNHRRIVYPRLGPDGAPHLARAIQRYPAESRFRSAFGREARWTAAREFGTLARARPRTPVGPSGKAAMEDLPYSESDTITVGGDAMSAAAPDFDPMLLSVLSSRFGAILREDEQRRAARQQVGRHQDRARHVLRHPHLRPPAGLHRGVHPGARGGHRPHHPAAHRALRRHRGGRRLPQQLPPTPASPHHADLTLCVPVFFDGKPLFWTVSRAHHADVGAPIPSTYLPYAKTIFEEGLHFPGVRVERSYKEIRDIIRMAKIKVRVPDLWYGDYLAQVGACRTASAGSRSWWRSTGRRPSPNSSRPGWLMGERRAAAAIRTLPAGTWSYENRHDPLPGRRRRGHPGSGRR